jgi:hypothetical protein
MSNNQPPGATPIALAVIMLAAAVLAVLGAYMFTGHHTSNAGEAAFVRACVMPDEPSDARCRDRSAIKDAWGIDIDAMIENRRALMAATARRMVAGELLNRTAYEQCIAARQCAPVPLLPDHIDTASLASSTAYLDTRKAFWQLAEGTVLTPEICAFMDICRAMRAAGVVTFP